MSPVLQILQFNCGLIPLILSIASKKLALGVELKNSAVYSSIGDRKSVV
jgi:hypothetical protein